jgi:predicted dehydrogenase
MRFCGLGGSKTSLREQSVMTIRTTGRYSRRRFLSKAASLAAAPWIVPASALGLDDRAAPSNRVTLGFIGVGMMGRGHLRCFLDFDDTQVLGVCDVDAWRRNDALKTVEAKYASAANGSTSSSGCRSYTDLRELLQRDDIDAVVVATGDRWHAVASTLTAKSGKDIYCEKPISLTIHEARAMVNAARRYGRVFQIGLQQRSAPEFQLACHLALSGALGEVREVFMGFPGTSSNVNLPSEPVPPGLDWDLWLGPSPWRPFNMKYHHAGQPRFVVPWDFCRDFGGKNLTSNAVHAFDVVQWGLGMDQSGPVEIIPPETGDVPSLTYRYANDVILHVDWKLDKPEYKIPEGWDPNIRLQNFGALFVGDEGWVHVGRNGFLQCYPESLRQRSSEFPQHKIAVTNHQRNWLDCIKSRETPRCDVAIGCQSTVVSHLGCIAHWTGRALRWDPKEEQFLNDDEANRMRGRAQRDPWRLV